MKHATLALLTMLLLVPLAQARDVDGTAVPDNLTLPGETRPLMLNGAGIRKKYMFKVYVGALYAGAPLRTVDQVLAAPYARVMRLHFLREVSSDKVVQGWIDGFAANHGVEEQRALDTRLTAFNAMMPSVKTGDVLRLELLATGQTRVLFNDTLRGTVDGADFQRALLKLWLGHKPADSDMKAALLAGGT